MCRPIGSAPPLSLDRAVKSGDYLAILRAQRGDILDATAQERGLARAALHRQFSAISREINELEAARDDAKTSVIVPTADEPFGPAPGGLVGLLPTQAHSTPRSGC